MKKTNVVVLRGDWKELYEINYPHLTKKQKKEYVKAYGKFPDWCKR